MRGGTLLRVRGLGFSGNGLHGGRSEARCRIGTGPGSVVAATIETPWQLKCEAPPRRSGRSTVVVSLNGGAEWYANNSLISPAAAREQLPEVVFEHTCDTSAALAPCLRDAACGWCLDHFKEAVDDRKTSCFARDASTCTVSAVAKEMEASKGRCVPCATDALTGAPRCDLGPYNATEAACAEWAYVRDVTIQSGTGGQSARSH